MLRESHVRDIFNEVGAMRVDGHYVYRNGKHGSTYVDKDRVCSDPIWTSRLCFDIANWFWHETRYVDIDVVVGPQMGATVLAQWTAFHYHQLSGRQVKAIYAEKHPDGEQFTIRQSFQELVKDKLVLITEDVINTGASARRVVQAVRGVGGRVVGVAALASRGKASVAEVGDPKYLFALLNLQLETWTPKECLLCKRDVPVNIDLGYGADFLAQIQKS